MQGKILVIGASGQVGVELILQLVKKYGAEQIIASDIREIDIPNVVFEKVNVLEVDEIKATVEKHGVETVYMLAAMLSAKAEKNPLFGWDLNMKGLFNVLNLAKDGVIGKIFWPSSIAVFGPSTPKENVPQQTITEPTSVYGISKLAGERWCEYYHQHYGVDVRSIRYPGLIGYRSMPGGGTTDYAVDIFHQALDTCKYTSFLSENSALPMMYMDDAMRATIGIMEVKSEDIQVRSSYNISGMSFTPEELSDEIKKHIPSFEISYQPDERQHIADSWPSSIDDSVANEDWGWKADFDLEKLVSVMISSLKKKDETVIST